MFRSNFLRIAILFVLLFFCLPTTWGLKAVYAQEGEDVQDLKRKVSQLVDQQKYTEALPLLEKLVVAEPSDPQTHLYLGFALLAEANVTKDEAAAKALRVRARNTFIRTKELVGNDPLVEAMIESLAPDGSAGGLFSQNIAAHKLMVEAEGLFGQGKLDEALEHYQKALQLDPKLYEAALFSGDVYSQKGDFQMAETWYQKAIAIDPNRETAYRYSATPLMRQRKYDEARDRYVEAYISEPYSRFSISGLAQWAQITKTNLAHPKIDIPTDITFDAEGNAKVNLDASAVLSGKEDGSFHWIAYGATRTIWRKVKFAQTFPQEKTYRHSLAEEADALRSVLKLAAEDKQVKKLNPSLAKLKKLDDEGLLEAYILLAHADEGIAQDHPAYLKQNRDKLRRYVVQYVLTGGGA